MTGFGSSGLRLIRLKKIIERYAFALSEMRHILSKILNLKIFGKNTSLFRMKKQMEIRLISEKRENIDLFCWAACKSRQPFPSVDRVSNIFHVGSALSAMSSHIGPAE